ncbi:MAG TPA: heme-binding protein, partial [Candidatus Saccharimonadia bacterium]|nr:heme-binding protein [Candidatus Saccharimonadia bacterium]
MRGRDLLAVAFVSAFALAACSGSGNSGDDVGTAPPPAPQPGPSDSGCDGSCVTASSFLTQADVGRVIAQAVAEAQAQGAPATIAVVDRVGNVLGLYRMNGARTAVRISSERGVTGGLDGVGGVENFVPGPPPRGLIPSELAAISKAVTGAYLSSEGNAFSTRTASQIVQEHFNPGELNAPSGPLFGVQFSQLVCSDLIQPPVPTLVALGATGTLTIGPKPAPLGLSADSGGFPLYKAGTVVGGVGVIADPIYGLDLRISDRDRDVDELIATAGTFGFGAPLDRRGDRITVDGKTFRYSDVGFDDLSRSPDTAPGFASLGAAGGLISAPFFYDGLSLKDGTVFTTPASGYRADDQFYAGLDAFVLVDGANQNRFPPRAGTDGAGALTAAEVQAIARGGLDVANRARAQIRRPLDSKMRVTISIVDTNGAILAVARTRDAPVFGTDVSLQKARTAAFFSGAFAAADLAAAGSTTYLSATGTPTGATIRFADYVAASRAFFAIPTLFADGAVAFTPRAIGNIARPYFPDGIVGTQNGPLSKPFPSWSPFTDGLQYDLLNSQVIDIVVGYLTQNATLVVNTRTRGCTNIARLKNGIQIFPGASPIYRGDRLVGAIGISGDGIDQDDMVSFLGLANASQALGGSVGHAPPARRSDQL